MNETRALPTIPAPNRFSSFRHRVMLRMIGAALRSAFVALLALARFLAPGLAYVALYTFAQSGADLGLILAGVGACWILTAVCWLPLFRSES